jgi:hypothetical protein
MAEIIAVFLAAIVVGAVFARWWSVVVPFGLAALWVAYAAVHGGRDSDGMPFWQIAAFVGTVLAACAALGLAAGIIVGRYVRDLVLRRRLPQRPH